MTIGSPRLLPAAASSAAALAAVLLAACGSASGGSIATSKSTAADKRAAAARLAKAPAALRVNAADADTLAGEGTAAFQARLARLKGHPVVVNEWASWCGPCRAEFPLFGDAVVAHADKVAFLGIDFTDNRGSADQFMRQRPPGFASIFDPKGDVTRSLGGGRIAPTTYYFDASGKRIYTKFGGYPDAKALEADIDRYALGEQ